MQRSPSRSEVASLRTGMMLILCWGVLGIVVIVTLLQLTGSATALELALTVTAASLAITGTLLRRRSVGGWLSEAALILLVVRAMTTGDTRMDILIMGSYCVAFFGIFLTSRGWGLVWIGIGVAMVTISITGSTDWVDVGPFSINVGWVAVLQALISGGWLWWAWHRELDAAGCRDTEAADQEHVIAAATALQERTRAWREAITRTHETILNDLRYVLRSPSIDHARLRQQLLTTRDRRAAPPDVHGIPDLHESADLAQRLRSEFPGILEIADRTTLVDDSRADIEPILVEIVRNIARYAQATRVWITVQDVDGGRLISVVDDGESPASPERAPGIGRSVVMAEALGALQAEVEEAAHRVVIRLPRAADRVTMAGRTLPLLLSIVLVASAAGGSPQFLLLLVGASATFVPVALAACCLTVLGVVTVLRRHRIGALTVITAGLLACIVTWGMVAAQPTCATTPLELTTINLSLNALFAILLWSTGRWAWTIVLPAFVAVLALDLLPGVSCQLDGIDVLLSSAVLMPVLIFLSWLSGRSTARWEMEDRARWETEVTEIARADAEVDLAQVLGGSVDQAWAQMWEIAEGAELTEERRRRLRTVESSIRASLQADPRVSGGFVLAARQVVSEAALRHAPIHVRALRGSPDTRPLPSEFIARLTDLVTGDPDADAGAGASIHVFFDGHDDDLAVTLPAATAARAGFTPGGIEDHGCCSIEVSEVGADPGDAEVTIMVSRRAESATPSPAMVE